MVTNQTSTSEFRLSRNERPECVDITHIVTRIVDWRFQDESGMRELWMSGHSAQCVLTDMALADVPVPVNSRVILCFRIVEMHRPDVPGADCVVQELNYRVQPALLPKIITGRKGMGSIKTDTQ